MKECEFFKEFIWAVPKAFSTALSDCRFERGDILYDTVRAYEGSWRKALTHIQHSIQVMYPPKSMAGLKRSDEKDSVFVDNWKSKVELEFTFHKENRNQVYRTTQGRLYNLLWHGEISVLENDSPEPIIPSRELNNKWIKERVSLFLEKPMAANGPEFSMFLMQYDETNDRLNEKHRRIQSQLDGSLKYSFYTERAKNFNTTSEENYVPTLYLACYRIECTDLNKIDAVLKKALYEPVKDKKTNRENWILEKHGVLETGHK